MNANSKGRNMTQGEKQSNGQALAEPLPSASIVEKSLEGPMDSLCVNCGIALDAPGLCSACKWLAWTWLDADTPNDRFRLRANGDTEGLVNRRWQMRFHLGLLPDFGSEHDTGILWETKRHEQIW